MGFSNFFHLEMGRFFDKRKLIILILFYLLSVYFIQSGIWEYKTSLDEIKGFQKFEKTRIDNFQYYDQYGTYGFRLLYVPAPLSALFSGAGIIGDNLNAFIDSGERMKVYESFKGKNAFVDYTSIFLNLSGLLFLLGSLLALLYGFESFRDSEFFILLENLRSRKIIFVWVLVSRLLLLLCCCLAIIFTAWILYLVNGLSINVGHLFIYGLVVYLMTTFFLFVGMVAGTLKDKRAGLVAIFSVWLLLTFGFPAIAGKIVYKRAESIMSVYKMDLEKFKLLMSFEKKAKEEAGQMDRNKTNTEIRRKLFNYLWDNEFKEIMGYEQTMIREMKKVISLYHNLSLSLPTSFFLSVNNEISGRGYGNLISFYEYAYKHKLGFVKYYADKSFFLGEKTVKPYLRGNANIFHASSQLPDDFGFGLVLCIVWLPGLLLLSWFYFNRLLNRQPESENDSVKDPKPEDIKKNKITLIVTPNPWRRWQLILRLKTDKTAFLSVPGPGCLPGDLKVGKILSFFSLPVPVELLPVVNKYCEQLSLDHKALIILEIVKSVPVEVLIFDNFLVGLSEEFKELLKTYLHHNRIGRRVAYFSNSLAAADVCTDSISYKSEKSILLTTLA